MKQIRLGLTLSMIFCAFSLSGTSPAADLQNIPVCVADDGQFLPTAVANRNNGTIVVWEDYRTGKDWDVYAQRIDASGKALWADDGIPICREKNNQRYIRMVNSGSQTVIGWTDRRSGRNWDVYAQAINLSGKLLWSAEGVPVCTHPTDQSTIAVLSDEASGAIIVWEDERRSSEFQDLYMQRLNASGQPMWKRDGIPIFQSDSLQSNPKLVSDDAGGFYIVWWDVIGYDQWHIMAHRLNMNGEPVWKAPLLVSSAEGMQGEPRAVSDGQGGVLVVWQDYKDFVNDDFYAQRIDSDGKKCWNKNGVSICDASGIQRGASITSDGRGGLVAIWRDERDVYSDLYAQRIDANGNPQWKINGVPICVAGGHQDAPFLTQCSPSEFFVAWLDYREDYGDEASDAIYGQKIDFDGRILWDESGVPICTASGSQQPPQVVPLDSGELTIVWSDARRDLGDIYLHRLK